MMDYEVLKEVRARTPSGEQILLPGELIELAPYKASQFIENGTIRPMDDYEQVGLVEIMGKIWMQYFENIRLIWPKGFVSSPEMREAEIQVEQIQKNVLEGRSTIGTFRQAVESWAILARRGIKH